MQTVEQLWSSHPRQWRSFEYVYPVISRRARGLSIGVNLNPDKVCNWDCVYCQVDRAVPGPRKDVDLAQLRTELDWMLSYAATGAVWKDDSFAAVPPELRRINDIAFSGDGEPTTCPQFEEVVALTAELKAAHKLPDVKIITLSNMTMAHRPNVQRGFALMDRHNGEIWAKLDAGTEGYYKLVDRSAVGYEKVLTNILETARLRPVVIQSLMMQLHGQPIPHEEFEAYLGRIKQLIAQGAKIKLVQLYTIARSTTESYATPLTHAQLDRLAERFRDRLPRVPVETYYGVD